jgi:aryl-alcohol dehydrogenase-like predicted oxidoreductase
MTRQHAKAVPTTSRIGLGTMGMSDLYGPADRGESIKTIRAALDSGISLIDTGDFYGQGHNELLIADAMAGYKREDIQLSVKFGALRDPTGGWGGTDNRKAHVKNYLAQSLVRLNTDYIDIYRPARLDPHVPIEETVGVMAEMVGAGYIRHIGLSEVSAETLRRAHAVHPIADLQIEYSMFSRGIEKNILATARELGIGITAYGVLSRGLISGHWTKSRARDHDFRNINPRFQGENLERNLELVERLRELASSKGVTMAQFAIAWVLAQGDKHNDIVALVGARRRDRLAEALGALPVSLSLKELAAIDNIVPLNAAAGARYNDYLMDGLDSEKQFT